MDNLQIFSPINRFTFIHVCNIMLQDNVCWKYIIVGNLKLTVFIFNLPVTNANAHLLLALI